MSALRRVNVVRFVYMYLLRPVNAININVDLNEQQSTGAVLSAQRPYICQHNVCRRSPVCRAGGKFNAIRAVACDNDRNSFHHSFV